MTNEEVIKAIKETIKEFERSEGLRAKLAGKTPLEKAKEIVKEYVWSANCGIYNCRNSAGDPMECLYDDGELSVDICYSWAYFEVFGLNSKEFSELEDYYEALRKGGR